MKDYKTQSPQVKKATKKRYNWPPPVAPEDVYLPKEKNPIHSVLIALPVVMLLFGLYIHYQGESEQTQGSPIRDQSRDVAGVFNGVSVVKSGLEGQHFMWVEEADGTTRGVRIRPDQVLLIQELERGSEISLSIAPTVKGSSVYWAWRVVQGDDLVLEMLIARP